MGAMGRSDEKLMMTHICSGMLLGFQPPSRKSASLLISNLLRFVKLFAYQHFDHILSENENPRIVVDRDVGAHFK